MSIIPYTFFTLKTTQLENISKPNKFLEIYLKVTFTGSKIDLQENI